MTAEIIIFPGIRVEPYKKHEPKATMLKFCARCGIPFKRIDRIEMCEPCRDRPSRRPDHKGDAA